MENMKDIFYEMLKVLIMKTKEDNFIYFSTDKYNKYISEVISTNEKMGQL